MTRFLPALWVPLPAAGCYKAECGEGEKKNLGTGLC